MKPKKNKDAGTRHPRFALIRVANKTGIENVSRALTDFGFELLCSRDNANALESCGIPVTDVADYTGLPEILDGAITSLHPRILGAIMARETDRHFDELIEIEASYIDIVICNLDVDLSRRKVTPEPASHIANCIDLVGPTLLKAAVKRFDRVATICDADQYEDLLWYLASKGEVPLETRLDWARRAFEHAVVYDSTMYTRLAQSTPTSNDRRNKGSCGY